MTTPPDRIEDAWLICKGGYFYRPDCCGYTTDHLAAGLYTEERARAECTKEPETMKALPAQRFAMAAHVRPGTLGHMLHTAAIAAAEARGLREAVDVARQIADHNREHWRADMGAGADEAADAIEVLIPAPPQEPQE